MNNTFNSNSLNSGNVGSDILQTSAAALSYVQQMQPQMHLQSSSQHLGAQYTSPTHHQDGQMIQRLGNVGGTAATTTTANATLYDPRQIQQFTTANVVDTSSLATSQPNTIFITNNFAQQNAIQMTPDHHHQHQQHHHHPNQHQHSQHHHQQQSPAQKDSLGGIFQENIRILSTPATLFNLNGNHFTKDLQHHHISPINSINNITSLQTSPSQAVTPTPLYARQLFPQNVQNNHFFAQTNPANRELTTSATAFQAQALGHLTSPQHLDLQNATTAAVAAALTTSPQYYIPTESSTVPNTQKILATFNPNINNNNNNTSNSHSSDNNNDVIIHSASNTPNGGSGGGGGSSLSSNGSTVVLDRINICINNHYNETNGSSSPSNGGSISTVPAQQPSPIIPAIQYKPIMDNLMIDPYASNDSSVLVIDEPDSTTTTPHTPPTTPETSIISINTNTVQSPSTTSTTGPTIDEHSLIAHQSFSPPPLPTNMPLSPSPPPPLSSQSSHLQNHHQKINIPNKSEPTSYFVVDDDDDDEDDDVIVDDEGEIDIEDDDEDEDEIIDEIDGDEEEDPEDPEDEEDHEHEQDSDSQEDGEDNVNEDFEEDDENEGNDLLQNELKEYLNEKEKEKSIIHLNNIKDKVTFCKETKKESPLITNVQILSSLPLPSQSTLPQAPPAAAAATSAISKIPSPSPPDFVMGEDVFINRNDGRFYLGTVINHNQDQYLVRFDDKSEIWCLPNKMRKLGGGSSMNAGPSSFQKEQSMCIGCKKLDDKDLLKICERCGRAYHKLCTTETFPGSGEYMCKRCAKPMKVKDFNENKSGECRQLPYHSESLSWDEKHRVNEEQIYCYCGKTGKFDQNMLQCCRCRNWFHTICLENFKQNLLRGDGFFVFSCSVCNDGKEFLRRLQMNWVDLVHLALYNLSGMKKHQHNKYHHLTKDINPFLLEHRKSLPISKEMRELSEKNFLDRIKKILIEKSERFLCGREVKKEHQFFALRHNGPPILPRIKVQSFDILNDDFLEKELKLKVYKAPRRKSYNNFFHSNNSSPSSASPKDIYEFHSDEDEFNNDEESDDSSDDEIPIQQILDKAKKNKMTLSASKSLSTSSTALNQAVSLTQQRSVEKLQLSDENANDASSSTLSITKQKPIHSNVITDNRNNDEDEDDVVNVDVEVKTPTTDIEMKDIGDSSNDDAKPSSVRNSRKRKAFMLSRDSAVAAAAKSYKVTRSCDTSSDENSSTSLNVIIPPPKNFLGSNNPFRMLTPKKDNNNRLFNHTASTSIVGNVIKTSIFNTNNLDLSSNLAALRSTGLFPNLSTTNLAKAAGQPRTVRTIKRRLSAKDILIGPNQEVRRRRFKRSSSSNVEVISQTIVNPLPATFFALHNRQQQQEASSSVFASTSAAASAISSNIEQSVSSSSANPSLAKTNRRLRDRPSSKSSPDNSRRSSISSSSSNSGFTHTEPVTSSSSSSAASSASIRSSSDLQDLKSSVNKYFGVMNRIESGEKFTVVAQRVLPNGQTQYLVEWGEPTFKPWNIDEEN